MKFVRVLLDVGVDLDCCRIKFMFLFLVLLGNKFEVIELFFNVGVDFNGCG